MRLALAACLVLASSTSIAGPTLGKPSTPRLRDRMIVTALPARARGAFASLAQQGWRATWDRDTGVAARLWGGHVDAPGALADPAIAERAARDFLAKHVALLAPGARAADFVVVANQLDGNLRTVGFAQTWRGRRVVGGGLGFVFGRDRLFAVGSSAWPDVAAALPARGGALILPLVRGGAIGYRAADVRELDGVAPGERWRVYVGSDGRELARESRVMTATGTLQYDAGVRYPGGTRADFAVPAADITVDGAAVTTAADGTFAWPGTAPATVVPALAGTYVRVVNQAGSPATAILIAQPGQPVVWSLASDEFGDAQLSTYIHANIAKARARIVNPSVAPWLDQQLDFFVNEDGTCNAYSTGDVVHLFRAGGGCENSGRLADVVFHEFGHSLHNHSVIEGMGKFESNLSEGLADYFAADINADPQVGRGFYLDGGALRDIDPLGTERVYPLDVDFDPHVSGLIIAGALWDLRKALIVELGEAAGIARVQHILAGIMQRADDIGTTFTAALIADDDDADLGNGTPSYCAIERAFGRHGLVPGFETTVVSPPTVQDRTIAMTVATPTGTTCTPPAVASIEVSWRIGDGVASTFALVPDGTTWRGELPAQPDGTVIAYSVDVTFDDGTLQVFPNNPADPAYQLFVGDGVPIYCESFDVDPMWPQESNAGFEWQWGPPVVGHLGDDPDAAFTGESVLGTDLTGDGYYRPNLVVSVAMPEVDVSMYESVHLQYWRWLTVEDALYDQATISANGVEVWRNATSQNGTLDHVDREWRFHDVDLTPHVAGGTLAVSWDLATDLTKELGGWTLDDVCLVGLVKIPRCGDGALDVGEECDDGNTTAEDGCDDVCVDEITAGGGGCCDAGGGGPGSALVAAAVVLLGLLGRGGGRRRRQRA